MGNSSLPYACVGKCETGCPGDATSELSAVLEVEIFPDVSQSVGQSALSPEVSVWHSGSDPAKTHVHGKLHAAVSDDNAAEVLELCSTAELDMVDMQRALLAASRIGSLNVARELVAIGVSVDSADPLSDLTPLHFAAYSGHSEMCMILLDAQADANCQVKGFTPMCIAREFRRSAVVEVLETHVSTTTLEQATIENLYNSSRSDLLPRVSEGLTNTLTANVCTEVTDFALRANESANGSRTKDDGSELSRMCMRDFIQLHKHDTKAGQYTLNPL